MSEDSRAAPGYSKTFVVQLARGHFQKRLELSPIGAAGLVVTILGCGLALVCAALYLGFRDEMLAKLLDRQVQMQYDYEDQLAALRFHLDRVTSRQFIDQDGVEGKVQSLVVRQAQLETRAALVAQLMERAGVREAISSAPKSPDADRSPWVRAAASSLPSGVSAFASTDDRAAFPFPAKPDPSGLQLRLTRDEDALAVPQAKPPRGSEPKTTGVSASLQGGATGPELAVEARLDRLSLSLDRIEREQTEKVASLVKPAQDAAGRLKRAFDVAGLPVERYVGKANERQGAAFLGGPYVPAEEHTGASLFERELAAAERAFGTLMGLRRALPVVPLRKPVPGEAETTSAFGYRTDPFLGRPALHTGVDLREEYGAPVRATAAGLVTFAGSNGGYGHMVEIEHGGGLTTRYAHLSAVSVSAGQRVSPGAAIGRVGSTGRSTGPHLHYEVRVDGEPVDPARFLRAAAMLPKSERSDFGEAK